MDDALQSGAHVSYFSNDIGAECSVCFAFFIVFARSVSLARNSIN